MLIQIYKCRSIASQGQQADEIVAQKYHIWNFHSVNVVEAYTIPGDVTSSHTHYVN